MTNEEAIKEIKRRNCQGYKHEEMCQWAGEGFGSCEECCYGLAMKVLENTTWIPVSERLPKDGQKVLVTTRSDNILDVAIDTSIFYHASAFWKHYVIAWMPLPESYKVKSEEI